MQTRIRLQYTEVSLRSREGEENRWTLGPDWYEDHQFDDDITPYYDGTFTSLAVDPAPSTSVQAWATKMIANTTDYRVKHWNGKIPNLTLEQHILTIWDNAGRESYTVTASAAQTAYGLLRYPNGVIVLPRHDGSISYLPVRSIARLNSTVVQSPVEN